MKKPLFFDQATWEKHRVDDIMKLTERMQAKDGYSKYPGIKRNGRCYNGGAIEKTSVYEPEDHLFLKCCIIAAVGFMLVWVAFIK